MAQPALGASASSLDGRSVGLCFDSALNSSQALLPANYSLDATNSIITSVALGPDDRTVVLRLTNNLRFLSVFRIAVSNIVFANATGGANLSLTGRVQGFTLITNLACLRSRAANIGTFACQDGEIQVGAVSDSPLSSLAQFVYGTSSLNSWQLTGITNLSESTSAGVVYVEGPELTNRYVAVFTTRIGSDPDLVRIETRYWDGTNEVPWPGSPVLTNRLSTISHIRIGRSFNRFFASVHLTNFSDVDLGRIKPLPWFSELAVAGLVASANDQTSGPIQVTFKSPSLFSHDDFDGRILIRRVTSPAAGWSISFPPAFYNLRLERSPSLSPGSWSPVDVPMDDETFTFFVPATLEPRVFFRVSANRP